MKTPARLSASLLALALSLPVGGCALLSHPAPPRVTLADLQLTEVKLFEQKYKLGLRIQNPNSFELHIEGLDYELAVNDQPFSTGVCAKPVTVAPYGTEVLEVEAFSDLNSLLKQLRKLDKAAKAQSLPYALKGHVRLTKGGVRIPFEHRGEFSFGSRREKRGEGTPGADG